METNTHKPLPVDRLYEGRQHFSIIGLTGMAGSGCSTLARYMSSNSFLKLVRKPEDIAVADFPPAFEDNEQAFQYDNQGVANKAIGDLVFKQKYSICYEFATQFYKEYRILKYTHVVWLYVVLFAKKNLGECKPENLKKLIADLLIDKYKPSNNPNKDADYKTQINYDDSTRQEFVHKLLDGFTQWDDLCDDLNGLQRCYVDDLDDSKKYVKELKTFIDEGNPFENLVNHLLGSMAEEDYYSLCFLYHRLASQIRKCGNPFVSTKEVIGDDCQSIYNIVKLINVLIKGIKHSDDNADCRIVIDSLRNSLEARYFKERYTAFYLICVNDSENREKRLCESIKKKMPRTRENRELLDAVIGKIKRITETELRGKEFSKGKFTSPDVENVIADAEIHINNIVDQNLGKELNDYEFLTMAEQWMKYSSLILHPGLITPSTEERCMVVAYTAKFNSSCLSRQVGAVITNQYHSIRTIGWNEVPYGQMPCGLRELHLLNDVRTDCRHIYSDFESGPYGAYGNKCFTNKVTESYPDIQRECPETGKVEVKKPEELVGLPFSYCFKTLHNTFEGEKNQVYTRSLHAEENAILQMAKYVGEPLMNGVIYVTASPCELCAKKLYQIGVRKIVYIDPYPGISINQIIRAGFKRPHLKLFQGAYGASYFKLYQPFMSYKDELGIRLEGKGGDVQPKSDLLNAILEKVGLKSKPSYTKEEIKEIVKIIYKKKESDNAQDGQP